LLDKSTALLSLLQYPKSGIGAVHPSYKPDLRQGAQVSYCGDFIAKNAVILTKIVK